MTVHIVQKGDTLWKIAKQHQIPFDEIKRLNAHLANPDYIVPGMEIFLPETTGQPKGKKEAPVEPRVIPMPVPKETPKKEMPVKETPMRPTPPMPAPPPITQQPPSWLPFPQPIPMPMPYPQQMQPIIMPQQQPAAPQTIRIEQPTMPMPMPIPIPQHQPMPMQCPSCRMTVLIAMPEQPKEEMKPEPPKHVPVEEKGVAHTPCSPMPTPRMEQAPWMQPMMPNPWGGGHCHSCQQPFHPAWHMHPPFFGPSTHPMPMPMPMQMPMTMTESTSAGMPQAAWNSCATNQDWDQGNPKCEMQQHIVNQYYDEIREIEQSNRPCHPHFMPTMQMPPYFQQ